MACNIKSERVRMGLDQKQFADALGVSRDAVSSWETDSAKPSLESLVKIANLCGCTTDYLVGLSDSRL